MLSVLLLALVGAIVPSAGPLEYKVVYDRKVVPMEWSQSGRASRHQKMDITIALRQQNTEKLEEMFWSVMDPESPHYQKFMSKDEILEVVKSAPHVVEAARSWLETGLHKNHIEFRGDAIRATATVEEVERLFQTEIYSFVHTNGHTILRAMGKYSVPVEVFESIDLIEGVADFPMHRSSPVKHPENREKGAPSAAAIVPQSLGMLYNFDEKAVPKTASQMPAEFQDDASFSKTDLTAFYKQLDIPDQTVQNIVGPFSPQYPDIEATLDTQYVSASGLGADNWYWTSTGWMYTFTQNLFNHTKVPTVVTMSWGWSEAQQCSSGIDQGECTTLGVDNTQYVNRVNTEFQKIGLRGVSLFASSGDSGANGRSDPGCTDKVLHPTFPAASPYLTAVGATQMETVSGYLKEPKICASGGQFQCAAGGTEESVSVTGAGFTSGGGFSNISPMPKYQQEAVAEFLKTSTLPPSTYFNAKGRAYPDVAANGNNYLIYIESEGGWQGVGGTSASSPTFAGLAARLNDEAIAKTGKPLGMMNQFLYNAAKAVPQAFQDIVKGDNKCTESGCSPGCKGFVAGKGWDAVSGLGTPNYAELSKYLESILEKRARENVVV